MNKILIRILDKLNLLPKLNLKVKSKLNNKMFRIPLFGKIGYDNLFISEPWMIELLKLVLPVSNGKFVDVGVNVGQTLIKLRSVSAEMEYIGFEPNPMCVNYVNELIKVNLIGNTEIVPVGVAENNEIGVLNFYSDTDTDSSASIVSEFRPSKKVSHKKIIPLFNLESIKNKLNIGDISILKIDVEGAELEVINSFADEITDKEPIILIEILPTYSDKNMFRIERQEKIQELLLGKGYHIYNVQKENDILIGIKKIKKIEIHSDLNKCDYVLVPNSKKDTFEKNTNTLLN